MELRLLRDKDINMYFLIDQIFFQKKLSSYFFLDMPLRFPTSTDLRITPDFVKTVCFFMEYCSSEFPI